MLPVGPEIIVAVIAALIFLYIGMQILDFFVGIAIKAAVILGVFWAFWITLYFLGLVDSFIPSIPF